MNYQSEHNRILDAYKEMNVQVDQDWKFFSYRDLSHFFRLHRRYWLTLLLLQRRGITNFKDTRILDVGCGDGQMLREFLQWRATSKNLAGIDIRPDPVEYALLLNPSFDIRCGSATEMPWADRSFDIVCQNTAFSSILDQEMRFRVASEMLRVVKPTGIILWYDFWLNPTNAHTRGINISEIQKLFPNCDYQFHKTTLAPPIARRIVPISWSLALFLEGLKIFNSHYIGLITPKS